VSVDPSQDGAEIVNGVADRVRRAIYRNLGLADCCRRGSTVEPVRFEDAAPTRYDHSRWLTGELPNASAAWIQKNLTQKAAKITFCAGFALDGF
jgi:hypothetical protein